MLYSYAFALMKYNEGFIVLQGGSCASRPRTLSRHPADHGSRSLPDALSVLAPRLPKRSLPTHIRFLYGLGMRAVRTLFTSAPSPLTSKLRVRRVTHLEGQILYTPSHSRGFSQADFLRTMLLAVPPECRPAAARLVPQPLFQNVGRRVRHCARLHAPRDNIHTPQRRPGTALPISKYLTVRLTDVCCIVRGVDVPCWERRRAYFDAVVYPDLVRVFSPWGLRSWLVC